MGEDRSLSHRIQNEHRGQVTGSRSLMRPEPSGGEETEYESEVVDDQRDGQK